MHAVVSETRQDSGDKWSSGLGDLTELLLDETKIKFMANGNVVEVTYLQSAENCKIWLINKKVIVCVPQC